MKKRHHFPIAVLLFLIVLGGYIVVEWLTLEGQRREAEHQLSVVVDLYKTLEKNSLQPLIGDSSLTLDQRQAMTRYQNIVQEIQPQLRTIEKIEKVRSLQRASFDVFTSATGAILRSGSFISWQRDAGKDGLAYPLLLNYNRAASLYNDSLQQWPISWLARLRGRVTFSLLNVDGSDYKQLPIEV